jgi:transposase
MDTIVAERGRLSSGSIELDGEGVRRRRRSWSADAKKRIVEETLQPGASVSTVARRHDINANLLFTWRRQIGGGLAARDAVTLVPAVITTAGASSARQPRGQGHADGIDRVPPRAMLGRMEIVLVGGARIIVDENVDAAALARVIGVLERP